MKALVFGANGFIGRNMVLNLEADGIEVVKGGRDGKVKGDFDYIFDFAAYGNLYDQRDINETIKANYNRVGLILEQANKLKKLKAIILTSTSSAMLPTQTPYSAAKVLMEYLAGSVERAGVPVATIRPYTVYGAGDNPKHFIPLVFDSCLMGTPMELDPEPTHDYIYIEDVVKGYRHVADKIKITRGNIMELGTGIATTNAEVVLRIEKITGKRANITGFRKLRAYDSPNWKAPVKTDFMTLQEGLEKIYENIKQRPETKYN